MTERLGGASGGRDASAPLNQMSMVYYNNLLSMPLTLGLMLLRGELRGFWGQAALYQVGQVGVDGVLTPQVAPTCMCDATPPIAIHRLRVLLPRTHSRHSRRWRCWAASLARCSASAASGLCR